MTNWLLLTEEERKTSIDQAVIRSGIIAKAIEKDWWVTLTLKALFTSSYSKYLVFKGGTSLSKGWKLIERFSEDIDIALEPAAFGREYKKQPSHSYVKTLKKEGCAFTSTVLKEALEKQFIQLGVPDSTISITAAPVPDKLPDRDPQTLYVNYKSLYPPHPYLADEVKIEFSVRSLKEPFAMVKIQSILSEAFPNPAYSEEPFDVAAVEPRKTLLEKAFLLHEKFLSKDGTQIIGDRQSRHLYDLVRMMGTAAEKHALEDHEFYKILVKHRSGYVRLRGIDYNTLQPANLAFVPPDDLRELFREDYLQMQRGMIYGESPDFDTMIDQLRLLNGRFRVIGEGRTLEEIIAEAQPELNTLKGIYEEGAIANPYVRYKSDIDKAASLTNRAITYPIRFIRRKNTWIFHSIEIGRSSSE